MDNLQTLIYEARIAHKDSQMRALKLADAQTEYVAARNIAELAQKRWEAADEALRVALYGEEARYGD